MSDGKSAPSSHYRPFESSDRALPAAFAKRRCDDACRCALISRLGYAPQFNRDALAKSLDESGIAYLYFGKELGGRAREKISADNFNRGLDRLLAESGRYRVAMMCAERDPLDCHRWLWLSRQLFARGVEVAHILANGEIESRRATEDRLLEAEGLAAEDFFPREERLKDAYRARSGHRAARVAAE